MNDELGTRMKGYERIFTDIRISDESPVYVRLDGRSFSKFTKGLERPFDARLSQIMIDTTETLMRETKADIGYTQSDEISLGFYVKPKETSQFMFDGKIQKLASTFSSLCSVRFYQLYAERIGIPKSLPTFDARFLNLPTDDELRNMFVWRQIDATKNAITMVAHHYMGHTAIMNMGSQEKIRRLSTDFNVDFHLDFPEFFKRGTYIRRTNVLRMLSPAELEAIPVAHRPTEPVERTEFPRSYSFE